MATNFRYKPLVGTGDTPVSAIAADIDRDGVLDLVVANGLDDSVTVRFGNGDGTFKTNATTVSVGSSGAAPFAVRVADIDGDGDLDILTANAGTNTVSVRLNGGAGGFTNAADVTVGDEPRALSLADLNGDGKLDLVVANGFGDITVNYGNRDGTFGPATAIDLDPNRSGSGLFELTTADVNGDGRIDIVAVDVESKRLAVVTNLNGANNTPTFAVSNTIAVNAPAGSVPVTVAVADMNGDGRLDYVTANFNEGGSAGSVSVRYGNGVSGLRSDIAGVDVAVGNQPRSLSVADVNGDGRLDIVTANSAGKLSVVYAASAGGFLPAQFLALTGSPPPPLGSGDSFVPLPLAVADLNGDGRADLVAGADGANSVLPLLVGESSSVTQVFAEVFSVGMPGDPVGPGGFIRFRLGTDVPVGATGTPRLALSNGGFADYGGTDSQGRPAFLYTVAAGQDTANLTVTGIDLNGGTIGANRTSFAAPPGVAVGPLPDVTAADLDGDGKLDLLAADANGNDVAVQLGNGDGTFRGAGVVTLGSGPVSVTTADLNGDGKLDMLTANERDASVSVRLGNGDGTFNGAADVGVAAFSVSSVTTADLNRDGKLDMILVQQNETVDGPRDIVSVRLGNGNGAFSSAGNVHTGVSIKSVTTADLNRDGRLDMLFASGGNVSVYRGNGDGTFSNAGNMQVGADPGSVTTADLNRDGKLDMLVANEGGNSVSVRLGNGDGTFREDGSTPPAVAVGAKPIALVAADLNGDGRLDLATANETDGTVSVRAGLGDGTFAAGYDIGVGGTPRSLEAADVNGDGRLDLVVGQASDNPQLGFASVLLNTSLRETEFDLASITGAPGRQTGIKVDTTAPGAPVIAAPANEGLTKDSTPTVSGTAEAGASVYVFANGLNVGSTTVGSDGRWSAELTNFGAAFGDGTYTVTAYAQDKAGNESADSAARTITVDTKAPAAPVIAAPANGALTRDATLRITGTAEANATVAVTIDGKVAGSARVGSDGKWLFDAPRALAEGAHTVSVRATDAAGTTGAPSAARTVLVDTKAPAAPVIAAPAKGVTTKDNTPKVSGTAEAGAAVSVFVDGKAAGTAKAASNGAWSLDLAVPLKDGAHSLTAAARDAAGNGGAASAPVKFVVDALNDAPRITSNKGAAKVTLSLAENKKGLGFAKASDPNGDALSWSISGKDAKLFVLDKKTGALSFKAAPDFEAPKDAGRNNTYDVTLKVSDGKLSDTQALGVKVANVEGATKTGTARADALTGTSEEDRIAGKGGKDTLNGLGGPDTFVFDTKLSSRFNVDKLPDFRHGEDTIALSNDAKVFAGLKEGALAKAAFTLIASATSKEGVDKDDRILFDKARGDLYFDRDGSGTKYARVKFAEVADKSALDHTDFLVV